MNRIEIVEKISKKPETIKMGEMEPLQIGKIISIPEQFMDRSSGTIGNIVMRTANSDSLEVIDLSNPRARGCWTKHTSLNNEVELLPNAVIRVILDPDNE